jgi:hypothetical protein
LLINDLVVDYNLDALALTETWHICNSDLPLRRSAPSGYSIIDAPRPGYSGDRTNHGGIAIVHRDCFAVRVITPPIRPTSFELLVCHVNLAKLVIVTVYRPSSQSISEIFFEELTSLLEIVSAYSSEIVISGDFNIHVDDITDPNARRFLDLLDAFDLLQHVATATHASGHTLDLVMTRPSLVPNNINVDAPVLSDHGLVTYYLPVSQPTPAISQCKTVRRLRDIDCDAFNTAVRQSSVCDGMGNLTDSTIVVLCDTYQTVLRQIVDIMAPPISVVVSRKSSMPWYDSECRACRRRVRALERVYRQSYLTTDCLAWSTALHEKKALFTSKEQHYWEDRLRGCAGDSKQLWHCLNTVLLRNDHSSPTHSTLTAQALADFFADKVNKVRAATQQCPPATFSGPCLTQFTDFQHFIIQNKQVLTKRTVFNTFDIKTTGF